MWLRRNGVSLLVAAVLVATSLAAYCWRERWTPILFPNPVLPNSTETAENHEHANDRVKLSPQAQQNLALEVDNPTPQEYWRTLLIPGSVVDRPGESDRGVTSKIAGVITDIRAKPGSTVKAGEPLFTLQLVSEFLQSAQNDLAKATRELEIATSKRDKVAEFIKIGTQSASDLVDAENQIKRVSTQFQSLRRQLQVYGLTTEQIARAEKGEVVTELVITTPKQTETDEAHATPIFEVQELKVHLGEQVQGGQTLCLLANHQRLYVEGRAFKSEADSLAAAAEKKVPVRAEFEDETPGVWKPQEPLRIHHLSNQVDLATRTFAFYLPLDNQPRTYILDGKTFFVWRYRPGQRVRLRMPVEKMLTRGKDGKTELLPFVFPVAALVREGPEAFVFVQNGDLFIRKTVHILHEDRNDVVIANDGSITEADYVVRNQAASINRALKSTEAESGHDHGHDH